MELEEEGVVLEEGGGGVVGKYSGIATARADIYSYWLYYSILSGQSTPSRLTRPSLI